MGRPVGYGSFACPSAVAAGSLVEIEKRWAGETFLVSGLASDFRGIALLPGVAAEEGSFPCSHIVDG